MTDGEDHEAAGAPLVLPVLGDLADPTLERGALCNELRRPGTRASAAVRRGGAFEHEREGRPCQLPYGLGVGQVKVLSRFNMVTPKDTVGKGQCTITCAPDGAAILASAGDSPTLVRAPGGQWEAIYQDQQHYLSEGDQISLDQHDPDAAVFAVGVGSAAAQQSGFDLHQYDQHQYGFGEQPTYGQPQNGYAEQQQQQQQYEPAGYY